MRITYKVWLLFSVFIGLSCNLLYSQTQEPFTEIGFGMGYCAPNLRLESEDILSRTEAENVYISPYVELTRLKLINRYNGLGTTMGIQGWKEDYFLLENEGWSDNVTNPLTLCSVSSTNLDFGIYHYLKYRKMTCTQSVGFMLGSLHLNARGISKESVFELGLNTELGLQYELNRNIRLNLTYNNQIQGKRTYEFGDYDELRCRITSPVSSYRFGVVFNHNGISKGLKWLH